VNAVFNLRVHLKCGEFRALLRDCKILKKGSAACSTVLHLVS